MNKQFVVENYEQLKVLSDPLRVKILVYLMENSFTGKQLGDILHLSPSKVHYHLKELEGIGVIKVVKTEEKNGILQKFYKSVAYSIKISDHLLPHVSEMEQSIKEGMEMILSRAKSRLVEAPEESFQVKSSDYTKNPFISTQAEVKVSKEKLIPWLNKYYQLMEELNEIEDKNDPNAKWFYMAKVGFFVSEPLFEDNKKGSGEDD